MLSITGSGGQIRKASHNLYIAKLTVDLLHCPAGRKSKVEEKQEESTRPDSR